jgi:hypothetical protein
MCNTQLHLTAAGADWWKTWIKLMLDKQSRWVRLGFNQALLTWLWRSEAASFGCCCLVFVFIFFVFFFFFPLCWGPNSGPGKRPSTELNPQPPRFGAESSFPCQPCCSHQILHLQREYRPVLKNHIMKPGWVQIQAPQCISWTILARSTTSLCLYDTRTLNTQMGASGARIPVLPWWCAGP